MSAYGDISSPSLLCAVTNKSRAKSHINFHDLVKMKQALATFSTRLTIPDMAEKLAWVAGVRFDWREVFF